MGKKIQWQSVDKWFAGQGKLLISGPCSAENRLQVLQTAQALASMKEVGVFRAGVWKPRTRPGFYEGRGNEALTWLVEAKKETGLPITVEVAKKEHVEACLKAGIDMLWIGARTTVSPFSVQEIADALRGVDIPVLVKNPVHPDIDSWVGALDRLRQVGIKRLVAVHRGFFSLPQTPFRNIPLWEIPLELKKCLPTINILCDPSHIAGYREAVLSISNQAMRLGMEGLMIESHINPSKALSDTRQQVTPSLLQEILTSLNAYDDASEKVV